MVIQVAGGIVKKKKGSRRASVILHFLASRNHAELSSMFTTRLTVLVPLARFPIFYAAFGDRSCAPVETRPSRIP